MAAVRDDGHVAHGTVSLDHCSDNDAARNVLIANGGRVLRFDSMCLDGQFEIDAWGKCLEIVGWILRRSCREACNIELECLDLALRKRWRVRCSAFLWRSNGWCAGKEGKNCGENGWDSAHHRYSQVRLTARVTCGRGPREGGGSARLRAESDRQVNAHVRRIDDFHSPETATGKTYSILS